MDIQAIHEVLAQLSDTVPTQPAIIGAWQIMPITGGTNNVLYRAISPEADVVIKWCIRDERQRAQREHDALAVLHAVQPGCAPIPIMVDMDRYRQPVVVQSYVSGAVYVTPPETDDEWQSLIECLARIHQVQYRPDTPIQAAVINAHSVATARQLIQTQLDAIPYGEHPAILRELIRALDATTIPELPPISLVLCHVDSNHRNFIRTPDGVVAVDWENSGWGDPAFEIAELIAHPAYLTVPESRWQWVIDVYCHVCDDPQAMRQRIETHLRMYRVWWVARFARYLYEVPRGRDQRLVARDSDWLRDMQMKYDRYLADAWRGLESS